MRVKTYILFATLFLTIGTLIGFGVSEWFYPRTIEVIKVGSCPSQITPQQLEQMHTNYPDCKKCHDDDKGPK